MNDSKTTFLNKDNKRSSKIEFKEFPNHKNKEKQSQKTLNNYILLLYCMNFLTMLLSLQKRIRRPLPNALFHKSLNVYCLNQKTSFHYALFLLTAT